MLEGFQFRRVEEVVDLFRGLRILARLPAELVIRDHRFRPGQFTAVHTPAAARLGLLDGVLGGGGQQHSRGYGFHPLAGPEEGFHISSRKYFFHHSSSSGG